VSMRETVMIGSDRSETDAERADNRRRGLPDLGVGDGAVIERAILDKDCRVGRNVRLVNQQGVLHGEGANYVIRDGIVVIPNSTVVPDGTVIGDAVAEGRSGEPSRARSARGMTP